MGFGNQEFSHIIPTDKFKGLKLEFRYFRNNPYDLDFWATLVDADQYHMATLHYENEKKWNALAEQITQFLPYPCLKTTDHQYY